MAAALQTSHMADLHGIHDTYITPYTVHKEVHGVGRHPLPSAPYLPAFPSSLLLSLLLPLAVAVLELETSYQLHDLHEMISSSTTLDWTDISPFLRDVSSHFNGRLISLPLLDYGAYLFYRRDLFQRLNISVPNTWGQMLELAAAWNGEAGAGDYPATPQTPNPSTRPPLPAHLAAPHCLMQ